MELLNGLRGMVKKKYNSVFPDYGDLVCDPAGRSVNEFIAMRKEENERRASELEKGPSEYREGILVVSDIRTDNPGVSSITTKAVSGVITSVVDDSSTYVSHAFMVKDRECEVSRIGLRTSSGEEGIVKFFPLLSTVDKEKVLGMRVTYSSHHNTFDEGALGLLENYNYSLRSEDGTLDLSGNLTI